MAPMTPIQALIYDRFAETTYKILGSRHGYPQACDLMDRLTPTVLLEHARPALEEAIQNATSALLADLDRLAPGTFIISLLNGAIGLADALDGTTTTHP